MSGLRRVVVLGCGWGSYSVFGGLDRSLYRVVLVSPRNHFLFTPLLASTTVGTLEFRSIIEPVRNKGFRQSADFHLAEATGWDIANQTLTCTSVLDKSRSYNISYDKLVIGVGALPNTFGVKGVHEHAFFLKQISDARAIRQRLLENFERSLTPNVTKDEVSRLLHTVIVGGGPTGVEFGAELYDFYQQDMTRLYHDLQSSFKVTLIESHEILSSFDHRLRSYAERKIKERKNFELLKSAVKEVRSDGVLLADGSFLPCGAVVWSTGLSATEFVADLKVERNKAGQVSELEFFGIVTDNCLRVLSDPSGNSFALGDCADIQQLPLPCTAQVAERQGRYLAKCLNDTKSTKSEPFKFQSLGMLAYIGKYEGLTDLPDFKLKGFASWFLWRSAYLTRLGSWRLRMQVPLDWLKTLIYGRDTSRF